MEEIEIKYEDSVVYLVDDDVAILDSLAILIKSTGLKIRSFESADAFLNGYCPELPGCLILDVRMPVMNGLELQEELSKRNIHIPIIFISGNPELPDVAKTFRAGAIDFLEKPFDGNQLIKRIHEALIKDSGYKNYQLINNKIQKRFDSLSAREKEVLQLIISSHSNKEVAKKLGISYRTVEAHRGHIMGKMQAENITHLVAMVVGHSLC